MSLPVAPPGDALQTPADRTGASPIRSRPQWPFAALCAALLSFQVYVIFLQPHGTPDTLGYETRPTGEVAGAVTLRQSLELDANGFDAITIYPRLPSEATQGQVVFELFELSGDPEMAQPIFRTVREATEVAAAGTYTWRFNPIDSSRDKRYLLEVSLPQTPFGRGLSLLATRDEHYRDGRLLLDGKQQWGDLVFSTGARRATSFRRFEHALRNRPAWLRSRLTLGALFAIYNLALAAILWTILTAPVEASALAAPPRAVPLRWRWGFAALLLATIGGLYFWLVPQPFRAERGAVLLLDQFPEAAKRTTMAELQQGFHYTDVTRDRRMRCVVALPPAASPGRSTCRPMPSSAGSPASGPTDGRVSPTAPC